VLDWSHIKYEMCTSTGRMFEKYPLDIEFHCPYDEILGSECVICLNFIDLSDHSLLCPCFRLGKAEAKRRTLEKIKNYVPFKRRKTCTD
jgi:hypothetical protein